MHYYQFNIGDYASHTRHLTALEDIALRRLLDIYYLHERPLNVCLTTVARQINMREFESEIKTVLEEFFSLTTEGWVNARADKEIAHYKAKIEQASKAGKASAERRNNARSTDVQPTNNQEPITNNHKTITINQEPSEPTASTLPKVKVPYEDIIKLFKTLLPELPEPKVLTDKRKRTLSSMWNWVMTSKDEDGDRRATTEHEGLEYFRRFFTYARKNDFVMGKTGRTGSHSNWQADIDYLCSERGRQQVIERTSA